MTEIQITDSFDDAQGRFRNYTAYDSALHSAIQAQHHVDIRNGRTEKWTIPYAAMVNALSPYIYWRFDEAAGATTAVSAVPAADYRATVLALPNIVQYLRLGETSGTNANDEGTGNLDGTYGAGVTLNQTTGGFIGDNNPYVELSGTSTGVITTTSAFTNSQTRWYMGWARRNNASTNDTLISSDASTGAPSLVIEPDNDVIWTPNSSGGTVTTWAAAWPGTAIWVHWLLRIQPGTSVELFINGRSLGSQANATSFSGAPGNLKWGASFNTNADPFEGAFDELAVGINPVSEATVRNVYRAGFARDGQNLGTSGNKPEPGADGLLLNESINRSYSFPGGNNQRVESKATVFQPGTRFTWCGIVEKVTEAFARVMFSGSVSSGPLFRITMTTATPGDVVFSADPTGSGSDATWLDVYPNDGQPHWIAIKFDDALDIAELLIDGVSMGVQSCTRPISVNAGVYQVGRRGTGSEGWKGRIDEAFLVLDWVGNAYLHALYLAAVEEEFVPISPTSVANLQGWYRPESLLQFADNAVIPQWDDSSGNARHMTEATERPLCRHNQVRGLPVADFDGTNDKLTSPSTFPSGVATWTVFAVVRGTTNRYTASINGNPRFGWDGSGPNVFAGTSLTLSGDDDSAAAVALQNSYGKVITTIANGANSSIRVNGKPVRVGDVGASTSSTQWQIGCSANSQFWNGEVVELMMFNTASMTDTNLMNLENYLMIKYGVVPTPFAFAMADHKNWHAYELGLITGSNTLTSYVPDAFGNLQTVNMLDGFSNTDEVVVTLPTFPLSSITTTTSFIDFTDSTGATSSVQFSAFSAGLTNGDSELRFPRSTLTGIDLSKIEKVTLRLTATAPVSVYLAAIRLLANDWEYASVDLDTLGGTLVSPVHPAASISEPYAFTVPQVWRSDEPTGEGDPRPIDASVSVVFNAGGVTGTNRFTVYFREVIEDYLTQLDLNGTTMADLNGKQQPDTGDGKWDTRDISTLEGPISELEGDTMFDLERIEDFELSSWFAVSFQWGDDRFIISGNAEDNGFSFEDIPALDTNGRYVAFIDVIETSFRVKLYPVTETGTVGYDDLIYDTGLIDDDFLLKRRKGRIGWEATLDDGGAYIEEVRTRYLNFAEYRSKPLESFTPIEGAQLFADFNPDVEHFINLLPGPEGGTVVADTSRTNSAESYKITNLGTMANRGVQSNIMAFDNFEDYSVSFDIWYPRSAIDANNTVDLYLQDRFGNRISLPYGNLTGDTWENIRVPLGPAMTQLTGDYNLVWVQPDTGQSTTWWLDNISVRSRQMRWEARAAQTDPWGDSPSTWVPFRDNVNSEQDGILFFERDRYLQVRGVALRQNVELGKVQVLPKYSQPGRLVWGDRESTVDLAAGLVFAQPTTGTTHTLDLGASRKLDRILIDFLADYGLFQIFGSTDNVTYTHITTQNPQGEGWNTFMFTAQPTYRYLRLSTVSGISFSFYDAIVRPALVPPTAAFGTSVAGLTVTFDGSSSTDTDGLIISWVWDFGDGAVGYGKTVKHTYAETGTWPVTLTVIDETGLQHQLTTGVSV